MEPSALISPIGKPRLSIPGTSLKPGSQKYPPVTCPPHSKRWPARVPDAKRSQSVSPQPNSWINGPKTRAASVVRPTSTISTSSFKASATGRAPKYALAATISLPSMLTPSMVGKAATSSPSINANRSSPRTTATRRPLTPSSSANSWTRLAPPIGFALPRFATIVTPCCLAATKTFRRYGSRYGEYPSSGLRILMRCAMANVRSPITSKIKYLGPSRSFNVSTTATPASRRSPAKPAPDPI